MAHEWELHGRRLAMHRRANKEAVLPHVIAPAPLTARSCLCWKGQREGGQRVGVLIGLANPLRLSLFRSRPWLCRCPFCLPAHAAPSCSPTKPPRSPTPSRRPRPYKNGAAAASPTSRLACPLTLPRHPPPPAARRAQLHNTQAQQCDDTNTTTRQHQHNNTTTTQKQHYCGQQRLPVGYDTLTSLYADPSNLSVVADEALRLMARSMIEQARARSGGAAGRGRGLRDAPPQTTETPATPSPPSTTHPTTHTTTPSFAVLHHHHHHLPPSNHRPSKKAQAVDERYLAAYAECTAIAKELASENLVTDHHRRFWRRGRRGDACSWGGVKKRRE